MYTRNNASTCQNDVLLFFHKLPFVCHKLPLVIPTVYLNIPFVINNKKNNGFTLIELVITLTIIGILLGVVAPNMSTFVLSNRLTTQGNEFIADINLARSEAIKQAGNVGICASSTGTSCTGSWQSGWIMFRDGDSSLTWTATTDSVLRTHESLSGNNTLSGPTTIVVFNTSGLLANSAAAGNFTLCNSQSGKSRVINIQATGRPSLSSGAC